MDIQIVDPSTGVITNNRRRHTDDYGHELPMQAASKCSSLTVLLPDPHHFFRELAIVPPISKIILYLRNVIILIIIALLRIPHTLINQSAKNTRLECSPLTTITYTQTGKPLRCPFNNTQYPRDSQFPPQQISFPFPQPPHAPLPNPPIQILQGTHRKTPFPCEQRSPTDKSSSQHPFPTRTTTIRRHHHHTRESPFPTINKQFASIHEQSSKSNLR